MNGFVIASSNLNSEDSEDDMEKDHSAMFDAKMFCCFFMNNMVVKQSILDDGKAAVQWNINADSEKK